MKNKIIPIIYIFLLLVAFAISKEYLELSGRLELFFFYIIYVNAVFVAICFVWVLIVPMKIKSDLREKWKKLIGVIYG